MIRVLALLLAAVVLAPARADAQLTCRASAGPAGQEVVAEFTVLSPADGAVLTQCGAAVEIAGTWSVSGPPTDFDVYVAIDSSSSTASSSGLDVDGDGRIATPSDDLFRAELAAARAFVDGLDPARSRVAVLTFADVAIVRQPLTADLDAVRAALDALRTQLPAAATRYSPALGAMQDQVLTLGDRAVRSQLGVFFADGQSSEPQAQSDAAAQQLADLGVVVDAFALTAVGGAELESLCSITGGRFVQLAQVGDVVGWLPEFVPATPRAFEAFDPASGGFRDVSVGSDGTFEVTIEAVPGSNRITLVLEAGSLVRVEARCDLVFTLEAMVVADGGPDTSACAGARVVLDGAGSFTGCAVPTYRWLDCNGREACPPSDTSSTCEFVGDGTCGSYTLEVSCPGVGCSDDDVVRVSWVTPEPAAARVVWSCAEAAFLQRIDAAPVRGWDLDPAVDADGNGDPADDLDESSDSVLVRPLSGSSGPTREIVAWTRAGTCVDSVLVIADFTLPLQAVYTSEVCRGVATLGIKCPPQVTCRWDLDPAGDSNGDGDPSNDPDSAGERVVLRHETVGDELDVAAVLRFEDCASSTPVHVDFVPSTPPRSLASVACAGDTFTLSCVHHGVDLRTETAAWDLDTTVDADGDGDPGNDVDETDCNVEIVAATDLNLRLWREGDSGCELAAEGLILVGTGLQPAEVARLTCAKRAPDLVHRWTPLPGVSDYRVLRGTLAWLWSHDEYDHGADDAAGAGTCADTGSIFVDDDLAVPGDFYYLVTALSGCGGGEGAAGSGEAPSGPFARPPGASPSCP